MFLIPPVSRGPEGLDPFIDLLAGDFEVIRHDQRGWGRARRRPGNAGRCRWPSAAAASDLLNHLGVDDVHVVGHSTGCGIAWRCGGRRRRGSTA